MWNIFKISILGSIWKKLLISFVLVGSLNNVCAEEKKKYVFNPHAYNSSVGIHIYSPLRLLNEEFIRPINLKYGYQLNKTFNIGAEFNFEKLTDQYKGFDIGPKIRYYYLYAAFSPILDFSIFYGTYNYTKKNNPENLRMYSSVFHEGEHQYFKANIALGIEVMPKNRIGFEVLYGLQRYYVFDSKNYANATSLFFRVNYYFK